MGKTRFSLFDLKVDEVSFVDRGDNPEAHIPLFKRDADAADADALPETVVAALIKAEADRTEDPSDDSTPDDVASDPAETTKSEGGYLYPAEAYAGVGDTADPSTWTARLWESPTAKVTAARLDALTKADQSYTPAVRDRIAEAWKAHRPDDELPAVLKSVPSSERGSEDDRPEVPEGFFARLKRRFGWSDEDVQKAESEWTPPNFDELQREKARRYIEAEFFDMIGSFTDALYMALTMENPEAKMKESADQFFSVLEDAIPRWSDGKTMLSKVGGPDEELSDEERRNLESVARSVAAILNDGTEQTASRKGVNMAVDREKLDPEVRAELEAAEKRAADAEAEVAKANGGGEQVQKTAEELEMEEAMKDASPAMRAYIGKLHGQVNSQSSTISTLVQEDEEEAEIAKARELGVGNADEFGKAMRRLKKGIPADGDADLVANTIRAMKNQTDTGAVIFDQVHQNGDGGGGNGTALAEATTKAQELMKSRPNDFGSVAAARAEVWKTNPDLKARMERGE